MKRITIRLDIVKERYEAASPGPWISGTDSCDCGGGYPCGHPNWAYQIKRISTDPDPKWKPENYNRYKTISGKYLRYVAEDMTADLADGEFMAFSRQDVPALEKALRIAVEALSSDAITLRKIGDALKPITRDKW